MSEDLELSWYSVVTADVRRDKRLTANAKFLYGDIATLSRQKGYCYASNAYFASLNDCSEQSVINWLNQLVKCGYIIRELVYDNAKKNVKERRLYLRNSPSSKSFGEGTQNSLCTSSKSFGEGTQNSLCTSSKSFGEGTQNSLGENNTVNNTVNNTINKYTADFEEFWKLYPRKVEKAAAYKAYKARLKEGVSKDTLLTAVKNYNRKITDEHTTETYIKYPKSFLSKDRNFDDYLEYKSPQDRQEEKPISKLVYEGDDLPF